MSRQKSKKSVFPKVLKDIIRDAAAGNKSFTLTDKQVRARLRAKFAETHVKNTSWVATNQRDYDAIRSAFDPAYAARNARKPRAKKTPAKTPAKVEETVE